MLSIKNKINNNMLIFKWFLLLFYVCFRNLNTTNLVYLTIEQVLADLGTFINTISIEKKKLLNDTKWVGFGSSYSGSLVTWLRLKYPHLIHAAVSSSSLLKAKVNFEGTK